ncbi:MAG TPA: DNA gyrase C-terminal beta-propeller domain-containing protein, partial [Bacteroidota bacterium]|nr:DNA gyrase C-terminal beta-propeller domain-containing protein [Bacteroidota bacterium]
RTTSKTGKVVSLLSVKEDDEIIVMTTKGIIIRQAVKSIRVIGRNTQGVKLIKLDEGDLIADITVIPSSEDEPNGNLDGTLTEDLYN